MNTEQQSSNKLSFEECLREEFLVNTQNYPKEYHQLFNTKFNRAKRRFDDVSNTINEPIKEQADRYAERVCNGSFPITYSREQVVKHTSNDYLQGASDFKKYVLGVLSENYNASKNLTDEDKIRPSNDMVNETYQDLIAIFTNPSKLNTEKPEPIKDEELISKIGNVVLGQYDNGDDFCIKDSEETSMEIYEIAKQYAVSQVNNTVEDKWISVEKELPRIDGDSTVYCLVLDSKLGIVVRPFNEYHNCWDQEDADDFYTPDKGGNITHWQPLPKPPIK